MIVQRPAVDEREVLTAGELTLEDGLLADNWLARGSRSTADGSAHPGMQLNVAAAGPLCQGDPTGHSPAG